MINTASELYFLANSFSLRAIHFLQPYWDSEEWKVILKALVIEDCIPAKDELEKEICEITGTKYALALNLGRSAIQVALEAFKFPPESEVIVPSFCCTGVIMPVIQSGLKPVLVDIDSDFNIRAQSVREALSNKTRAIIMPHLSGKFAEDTFEILDLARQYDLKVIDDACQSFGLKINDKWTGTFGDVGIFSFGLGKNLFGPGGGILITNNESVISHCKSCSFPSEQRIYVKIRLLRFLYMYALRRWTYPFLLPGYAVKLLTHRVKKYFKINPNNFDNLQNYSYNLYSIDAAEAALTLCQVQKYQTILQRRSANASILLSNNTLNEIGINHPSLSNNIYTKFLVTYGNNSEEVQILRDQLRCAGVETEASYTPLHLRKPFDSFKRTSMSITEQVWQGAFSIPINPCLEKKHMKRILQIFDDNCCYYKNKIKS